MENIALINGRYQIVSEIGHGGYSKILLSYDKIKNKEVAIKVLKKDKLDEKGLIMIKQEAMTMAALNSTHIAKIYECNLNDNEPYIVMDYVRGKILKDLIKEQGYLLVEEVYRYMMQIIDGLEVVHNAGIVHRDIKPANMIKQSDGNIVLVDFGTAIISDKEYNLIQEDGKTITGTVFYMAPEYTHYPSGTIQTDIYALGVSMFEMFTNRYPFKAKDQKSIIMMHKREPFPSVRKFNSNVPVAFENIIYKCCEKGINKRYKNVAEIRVDLLKAYNEYINPKKKNIFERIFKK